jgi:hypothetical protein
MAGRKPMDRIDTLNIECSEELLRYLRDRGRVERDELPVFTRLSGGVSNRAVRVDRPDGGSFVLKQALSKLRVESDWFSDPRRIEQEALGLVWLDRLAPSGTITPLLFQDADQHLLAMQAVPHPHENWKTQLLAGRLERQHVEQFAVLLGTIHRRSWETSTRLKSPVGSANQPRDSFGAPPSGGLPESRSVPNPDPVKVELQTFDPPIEPAALAKVFDDRTFFESLRLEPYYRFTASRYPDTATFFADLIAETLATRLALTHGDYSPKNILVYQNRLVLLDHEVIHFGDPAFDLGFSLTHLLSKAHHLPDRRQEFFEAARCYWQTYQRTVGELARTDGFETRGARHTLGCLLARVVGRSPLEYLSAADRARQRAIVLALLLDPVETVLDLVAAFEKRLGELSWGNHEIREPHENGGKANQG